MEYSLTKAAVTKVFNNTLKKPKVLTVIKEYDDRVKYIDSLKDFLHENRYYFIKYNSNNLQEEIKKNEKRFDERKKEELRGYKHYSEPIEKKFKDKYEYARFYTFKYNKETAYFLEKYRPDAKTEKEVFAGEIELSFMANSKIYLYLFFDKESQLCVDLVTVKDRYRFYEDDIEKETISFKTDKELIISLISKLKEENEEILKKRENLALKKSKIKALTNKGLEAKIESIMSDKKLKYDLEKMETAVVIEIEVKKGYIRIKIPKKQASKSLETLSELVDLVVKANEFGIECRYQCN